MNGMAARTARAQRAVPLRRERLRGRWAGKPCSRRNRGSLVGNVDVDVHYAQGRGRKQAAASSGGRRALARELPLLSALGAAGGLTGCLRARIPDTGTNWF